MAYVTEATITLSQPGRQLGPDPDAADVLEELVWAYVPKLLSEHNFVTARGVVTIEVEWPRYLQMNDSAIFGEIQLNARLIATHDRDLVQGSDLLKLFLYHAYLSINLAIPGAFSFGAAVIAHNNEPPEALPPFAAVFEWALITARKEDWRFVHFLSLTEVTRWLNGVNINITQLASRRIEKALFSLLHIANTFGEPGGILWIAQALESLYDVPPALSRHFLNRRLRDVLQLPDAVAQSINKRISSFYTLRNSIAHGGAAIMHPVRNEILDPSLLKHSNELITAGSFGLSLIIGTIQQCIRHNCDEFGFRESVVPITIV